MRYVVARVQKLDWPLHEVGQVVLDTETGKLTGSYLLTGEEAVEIARTNNEAVAIREHWPAPDDAEVADLLTAPEFVVDELETRAYARRRIEEHVARKRAGLLSS